MKRHHRRQRRWQRRRRRRRTRRRWRSWNWAGGRREPREPQSRECQQHEGEARQTQLHRCECPLKLPTAVLDGLTGACPRLWTAAPVPSFRTAPVKEPPKELRRVARLQFTCRTMMKPKTKISLLSIETIKIMKTIFHAVSCRIRVKRHDQTC